VGAGAGAQLLGDLLVEALDLRQLVDRDEGDLLDAVKPSVTSRWAITSSTSRASMNICERSRNSSCGARFLSSVMMSMSQPVSCEASRTFWPRRPMAS
jgi:hypothetical protein